MTDLTPQEYRDEIRKLTAELGPKAYCYTHIRDGCGKLWGATFYPQGMDRRPRIIESADTLEELLAALKARLAEYSSTFAAEAVDRMALDIISITAASGSCTTARLRDKDWTDAQIAEYGAAAVAMANEIAQRRQFGITDPEAKP